MTQPAPPRGAGTGGMQTGKAVLVIAVVVVVGWVILHHGSSAPAHSSTPSTTQPAVTTPVTTPPTTVALKPAATIKLQVLNGVLTGNLSSQWSAKLKANPGYDTLPALNATSRVTASQIYIMTPGLEREANALALAVGLPVTTVVGTVPPPSTAPIPSPVRSTANLVLVVGPDLAGSA